MRRAAGKTNIHYMVLSLSNYVNRAAMVFDAGERSEIGTCIRYIAMSMSNYVNRTAMEFG